MLLRRQTNPAPNPMAAPTVNIAMSISNQKSNYYHSQMFMSHTFLQLCKQNIITRQQTLMQEKKPRSKSLMSCCQGKDSDDSKQVNLLLAQKTKGVKQPSTGFITDYIAITRPAGAASYRTQIRTSFKPKTNFSYQSPPALVQKKLIPQQVVVMPRPLTATFTPITFGCNPNPGLESTRQTIPYKYDLELIRTRNKPETPGRSIIAQQKQPKTTVSKRRPSCQSSLNSRVGYDSESNHSSKVGYDSESNHSSQVRYRYDEEIRQKMIRDLMEKYKNSEINLKSIIHRSHEMSKILSQQNNYQKD